MRTKKSKAIENEMISSSDAINVISSEEKPLKVRDIQYIAIFHIKGSYESQQTIYCADRAELDQMITAEIFRNRIGGGARVFKVERDIEW